MIVSGVGRYGEGGDEKDGEDAAVRLHKTPGGGEAWMDAGRCILGRGGRKAQQGIVLPHLNTLGVSASGVSAVGVSSSLGEVVVALPMLLLVRSMLLGVTAAFLWRVRLVLDSEVDVVEEEGGPQGVLPPTSPEAVMGGADTGVATDPLIRWGRVTSFGREEEEEASRGQESRRAKRSATALELCRPRCCCCSCCCCWGPGLVGLPQEDSRELRPLRVCHTGPAGPAPSPPLTFIPTSPPHPHPRGRPHACPSHTVPDGGPVSGRLSSGREGGGGLLRRVGEGSLPRAASPGVVAKGCGSSVPASSGGHLRQSSLAPQLTVTLTLLMCGCRQAFLNTWPVAQPRSLKPSGGEQRPRARIVTLR
ncbi:hypothetical protein E2C01_026805 [Portunus trituberculatus]|uniref:Uncharacterized protein n=1 Tax=Portunus trituberculatus TaxID=210409 RepID=A0A5B7EJ62_PORTR|nr:hypothetical protein [Portunus trituberculatus]